MDNKNDYSAPCCACTRRSNSALLTNDDLYLLTLRQIKYQVVISIRRTNTQLKNMINRTVTTTLQMELCRSGVYMYNSKICI